VDAVVREWMRQMLGPEATASGYRKELRVYGECWRDRYLTLLVLSRRHIYIWPLNLYI
jgi:hypothetical protein